MALLASKPYSSAQSATSQAERCILLQWEAPRATEKQGYHPNTKCEQTGESPIVGKWYNSCVLKDYTAPKDSTFVPGKVLGVSAANPNAWESINLEYEDFTIKTIECWAFD